MMETEDFMLIIKKIEQAVGSIQAIENKAGLSNDTLSKLNRGETKAARLSTILKVKRAYPDYFEPIRTTEQPFHHQVAHITTSFSDWVSTIERKLSEQQQEINQLKQQIKFLNK